MSTPDISDIKAAFERWHADEFGWVNGEAWPVSGEYCDSLMQSRWQSWQAATEAAKATGTAGELPPLPIYYGNSAMEAERARKYAAEYGQACAEAALCAPDGESWQHKAEENERAVLYWKAKAKQSEAARQPAPVDDIMQRKAAAFDEWIDKTEWVQKEQAYFHFSTLGKHRADVVREEINWLRAALAATAAPVLSDEQAWKLIEKALGYADTQKGGTMLIQFTEDAGSIARAILARSQP